MIQIVKQTESEKIAMYMKCSKKELISMLMENQRLVDEFIINKRSLVTPFGLEEF